MNNKCQETGQEGYEGTEEIMAGKPSLEDREMVQDLSEEDCTQREIGALVNRSQTMSVASLERIGFLRVYVKAV